MARSRGSRFPRTSGASRRRVSWQIGPTGSVTGVVTTSVVAFTAGVVAALDDLTLIRTRGELLVYLTVAGGASNEGFRWAFGMAIASENAFGIGITALMSPLTDLAWDGWFVHEQGSVITPGTTLDGGISEQVRVKIDSKAMRKLHQTDSIYAVIETSEQGDGASLSAQLMSRMLVKLP